MASNTQNRSFFEDFKKYIPLLSNLTLRDIKVKYRRSVLGILWSVLNPLLTMLVLTTVFSMMFRIQVENFASFYIIGAAIWNFFCEATSSSLSSVVNASSLIKKVYVPKYIFPLEKCMFSFVNFAFSLVAVIAVMLIQGVYPTFTMLLIPIPIVYCFIFSVGMSLILSALTVYFRDIMHLYGVLLTMWMYLTPIIYNEELLVGHDLVYTVVKCNPMYYYVTYFRDLMMYNTVPGIKFNLISLGIALVFFIVGVLVFRKAEKNFILHI